MSYTPGDILFFPNSSSESGSLGRVVCMSPKAADPYSVKNDAVRQNNPELYLYNNYHTRFHPSVITVTISG